MPKDTHQKAAEHHENAAKAHRTAAESHAAGVSTLRTNIRKKPMCIPISRTNTRRRRGMHRR